MSTRISGRISSRMSGSDPGAGVYDDEEGVGEEVRAVSCSSINADLSR